MTRRKGDRNRDFEAKRTELLDRLHGFLAPPPSPLPSARELAAAAGVSLPTLRHYFGNREQVLAAVMDHQAQAGEPYVMQLANTDLDFEPSVREMAGFLAAGLFAGGVSDIHAFGLAEGAQVSATGRHYLEKLLEPSLAAIETRLSRHVAKGEMRPADLRFAALMLASPLLLAALHQRNLGGRDLRPLEANDLADEVSSAFFRAFATSADLASKD